MQAKATVRVPASTLGDLDDYIDRQFGFKRHGAEIIVKLDEVKRDSVILSFPKEERSDRLTVSQAKFRKFYCLLTTAKVETPTEAS